MAALARAPRQNARPHLTPPLTPPLTPWRPASGARQRRRADGGSGAANSGGYRQPHVDPAHPNLKTAGGAKPAPARIPLLCPLPEANTRQSFASQDRPIAPRLRGHDKRLPCATQRQVRRRMAVSRLPARRLCTGESHSDDESGTFLGWSDRPAFLEQRIATLERFR